ncbi:hypothetical protein PC128_g3354 [Phytophthora cactorum]|nr:hypothetical protein PC121_g20914 [Phytophthora cactorum]KAG3202250.1 hypothetical protein PC128_g3354 [Phytophthora cactorum]KAG4042220.1 hypothetical protein PC123_g22286 [Phytophthora cactorum]
MSRQPTSDTPQQLKMTECSTSSCDAESRGSSSYNWKLMWSSATALTEPVAQLIDGLVSLG